MKRSLFKKFVIGVVAASIMCVSCKNETQDSVPQLFEENPTTISWDMSKSDSIDTILVDTATNEIEQKFTASDPGSVETIIELYQDIQINVADDSVFKLIMEF